MASAKKLDYDVAIIGAGVSGVCAAWHVSKGCPDLKYAVFEGRSDLGGTWDLFKYPGIRSDSDLFTFGYSFRPWDRENAIAEGNDIKDYVRKTAEEGDIIRNIKFNTRVVSVDWRTKEKCWKLKTCKTMKGELPAENAPTSEVTCKFVIFCSGYYNYHEGHNPTWPGLENFKGEILHPQFWDEKFVAKGKRIAIVGSGATAVTLLPSLASQGAKLVTMVQRSPTYIAKLPSTNHLDKILVTYLGKSIGGFLARWVHILEGIFVYNIAQAFPKVFAENLRKESEHLIGSDKFTKPHLTPHYKPWDQRVCVDKDGVMFECLKNGKADIATGHITEIRANELVLDNGRQTVEADVLITATGLKMQMMGGAKALMDGTPATLDDKFMYKGMMLSGVPNLVYTMGYVNASWTLRCELVHRHTVRILKEMQNRDAETVEVKAPKGLNKQPLLGISSGYVRRALSFLPAQGDTKPWLVRQNYVLDCLDVEASPLVDEFVHFG